MLNLRHDMADTLPELCLPFTAAAVANPSLVVLNEALARDLGIDTPWLAGDQGVAVLSGNTVPEGSEPVALAYAGHQFGNYSPRLGDGRAVLLGEIERPDGSLADLHLKGSGRTPFARGGDGRATLGPMLREYLVSEFLHTAGVPTTRSLAVVATGEAVLRDGFEPGAVLDRVAASHIRVGTFEYAVRLGGPDLVRRLADYSIVRHYPEVTGADEPYRALLESVVDAQARLVAHWMTLGFIHGVMNTDNMTISGEGIDYGPCAFMDTYDPATVFSSIDHGGRYAYGNQVRVAAWNLARLAETMLDLIGTDVEDAVEFATNTVNGFVDRFRVHWDQAMARKLGLPGEVTADASALFDDLPSVMSADSLDWTGTFRYLASRLRVGDTDDPPATPRSESFEAWVERWRKVLAATGGDESRVADQMDRVNPLYIPRNHLVARALDAATAGELDDFFSLVDLLAGPYVRREGMESYEHPAPAAFTSGFRTFCGT